MRARHSSVPSRFTVAAIRSPIQVASASVRMSTCVPHRIREGSSAMALGCWACGHLGAPAFSTGPTAEGTRLRDSLYGCEAIGFFSTPLQSTRQPQHHQCLRSIYQVTYRQMPETLTMTLLRTGSLTRDMVKPLGRRKKVYADLNFVSDSRTPSSTGTLREHWEATSRGPEAGQRSDSATTSGPLVVGDL